MTAILTISAAIKGSLNPFWVLGNANLPLAFVDAGDAPL